jgi:hypothetical protein
VARSASSFARCRSPFARWRSASVLASLPRTVASDALAFWASAFTRSSSFSVESARVFGGSLVDDGRGAVSAGAGAGVGVGVDGAGCIVRVEGEDEVRVVTTPEGVASADLKARTSRAISIQVMSSV